MNTLDMNWIGAKWLFGGIHSRNKKESSIPYIPLLINKFRYFSRKGYSQFPKAEYSISNQNLLLGIGIKKCAIKDELEYLKVLIDNGKQKYD